MLEELYIQAWDTRTVEHHQILKAKSDVHKNSADALITILCLLMHIQQIFDHFKTISRYTLLILFPCHNEKYVIRMVYYGIIFIYFTRNWHGPQS